MSDKVATFKEVMGYDAPNLIKCYFPGRINANAHHGFSADELLHLCDDCARLCDAQYAAAYDGDCVECEVCRRSYQEIAADRMRNSDFNERIMNKHKRAGRIASVRQLTRCIGTSRSRWERK